MDEIYKNRLREAILLQSGKLSVDESVSVFKNYCPPTYFKSFNVEVPGTHSLQRVHLDFHVCRNAINHGTRTIIRKYCDEHPEMFIDSKADWINDNDGHRILPGEQQLRFGESIPSSSTCSGGGYSVWNT